MLHACFYTICLVFRYTSWHFYAIYGTNVLTRCHSASSLFSAVFVFQKSYTGNILGIGRNKFQKRLLAPLEKAKHAWVDELPSVLWSLRTTPNATTQETPFFLVHGAEAVLPVEITHEVPRIMAYDETTSTEALQDDVDALDEARDVALARATQYQQNLRNYHSSRVCPRSFVVGDLVLRLKQDGHEKLESPWVGPYIVTEVIPGGAYRLQDKKTGKDESNPWNAEQLRRFYA
jgi:hypothetical protein